MPTTTTYRGLTKPVVSSDDALWGTELNATIDGIDSMLGGSITLQTSAGMAVSLTSAQAQMGRIVVTGALSTDYVLTFPQSIYAVGLYAVWNNSSAGNNYNLTCKTTAAGGGTISISTDDGVRLIDVDGTNVQFADSQVLPLVNACVNFTISGGGGTPAAGNYGTVKVPFTFTTSSYELLTGADAKGSASVQILHATGMSSTFATEATLTISSAYNAGGSYGPFTYTSGDLMGFSLVSSTSLTSLNIAITGTRSLSS